MYRQQGFNGQKVLQWTSLLKPELRSMSPLSAVSDLRGPDVYDTLAFIFIDQAARLQVAKASLVVERAFQVRFWDDGISSPAMSIFRANLVLRLMSKCILQAERNVMDVVSLCQVNFTRLMLQWPTNLHSSHSMRGNSICLHEWISALKLEKRQAAMLITSG